LFQTEDPSSEEGDFKDYINDNSLQTVTSAYAEPALKNAKMNERYQFLRKGYFTLDTKDTYARLVFNRTVTLKDTWAKEQKKG
jgi:glutaminyl-tRNA synthetase